MIMIMGNNLTFLNLLKRVRVNQRLYFPLSAVDFLLSAAPMLHLRVTSRQGGSGKRVESGKSVEVSGK
jgi:hypothetical protein